MIDSRKKKLSISEIINQVAYSEPTKDVPPYAVILSIIKEGSLPNTEVKQYGNTVFVTHFSEDRDLAIGRALNFDVANNFVNNGEKYMRDLVKNGTTKFVTQFEQKSFARAFMALNKGPITTEMKIHLFDLKDGQTQVRISLKGDLIKERKK